jgi:hypothetical protein
MSDKWLLVWRPSLRKDRLFERGEYIGEKIVAVHFGLVWELVDNVKAIRVPHHREHEFSDLDIQLRLWNDIIS